MAPPHYLIIGQGAAGMSAAEAIRRLDPHGQITLAGDEGHRFYSRPGIAYLLIGQITEDRLFARRPEFYTRHRFTLLHDRVTALDTAQQIAHLAKGGPLRYDVALLATGSTAVRGRFPGADLDGVVGLDNLDNARHIIKAGKRAKAAVVIGGGVTAMELAEGLRHQGARVHWLQRQERIWPRLFNEDESAILAARVQHEGITLHYREEIAEAIGKNGKVAAVRLTSGREIACQVIGVGIGVKPNLQLTKGTPIQVDQGVRVNEYLQTTCLSVFAAGDVAQVYDRWAGSPQVDTLWPGAIASGRAAGANMVAVAHGRAPANPYIKGCPFNAALLFGLHLTVIGRIGDNKREEDVEESAYLSRGASHTWTKALTPSYRSAWDRRGPNALRIAISGGRLAGALLLGEQRLAQPLRELIAGEVDISAYESDLLGPHLPDAILRTWQAVRSIA